MKFEKYLKSVGTHGQIYQKDNGEKWLICGGVGVLIPAGVENLLGVPATLDSELIKIIINSETSSDIVTLKEALLFEADGKAGDIVRVFESEFGDRVGIYNGDFGLLEKSDRSTILEVEIPDKDNEGEFETVKFLVVINFENTVIGFIRGTKLVK